jgi:uncharacterized protein
MAETARILLIQGGGRGAYEEDAPLADFLHQQVPDPAQVAYPKLESLELEWTDWPLMRQELEAALSAIAENGQVVAHSFGGAALLKFLSVGGKARPIKGLFLVAVPYMCADGAWGGGDFAIDNDFAARLPDCGGIHIYHSRDDDIVPVSHAHLYAAKLPQAKLRLLDGYGHQFCARPFGELAADLAAKAEADR